MAENSLKKGRYTRYSNKIGLVDSKTGGFINNSPEVILNFPFKDCVLEAGMNKEDAGREERFLHSEIDAKDIDTLFDAKVLTDFRYIDKNGERKLTKDDDIEFFDENGDLKQNLLIKGNNLLALHTLKEKLAGKVKLIYIDPPYNTGNDGFKYNDAFNHSSWLTFMKNRLEIARELLRDDGVIFVQIDNSPSDLKEGPEMPYLGVLMDEIFGRNNYLTSLIWRKKGNASNTIDAGIGTITETIFMYAKNIDNVAVNLLEFKRSYKYSDEYGDYNLEQPLKTNQGEYERETMLYEIKIDNLSFVPPVGKRWTIGKEKMDEIVKSGKFVIDGNKFYIKKYRGDYVKGENKLYNNLLLEQGSLKIAKTELENLGFNKEEFSTPKPEALLQRILELASQENDLVFDFCLGSGTTTAVAHKMGRRWIGIEQMDYIEDISKVRLKKVIDGERGGISKDINWRGGGSFVYFELKKYNQAFIDRIMEAASIPELEEIYEDMQKNAFLKFWFDKKEFEKDENFRSLDIYERKQKLVDILDENQFYLNYDEMEDSKYHVTEDEKVLTKRFYQDSDEMGEIDDAEE